MPKSSKILLTVALLLLVLTATALYYTSAVFLQLFIAFALAYILNPAVAFLERKGVRRLYGILIVFTLTLVVCTGFAVFMAVSVSDEFSKMQLNLP
ncbi:MAG: AI-2E family transporter, partial [Steroidobacteraceae bacterium]|nr:AI-2E family transporter [Deltaproteobacteria bacterium]